MRAYSLAVAWRRRSHSLSVWLVSEILSALEEYAKYHKLADVVALRAAVPKLVQLYERKGYRRSVNAMNTPVGPCSRILSISISKRTMGQAQMKQE